MKIHYRTGNIYELDLTYFDSSDQFKKLGVYKYDYVKKLNDEWLKVIDYLYRHFSFEILGTTEQYFTVERLDENSESLIYDFGFNVPKIKKHIVNNPPPIFEMLPVAFGTTTSHIWLVSN